MGQKGLIVRFCDFLPKCSKNTENTENTEKYGKYGKIRKIRKLLKPKMLRNCYVFCKTNYISYYHQMIENLYSYKNTYQQNDKKTTRASLCLIFGKLNWKQETKNTQKMILYKTFVLYSRNKYNFFLISAIILNNFSSDTLTINCDLYSA